MSKETDERAARLRSRSIAMVALLWLVTGALAVRQLVVTWSGSHEPRLTEVTAWLARNSAPAGPEAVYDGDAFTGPPFAAALLRPFGALHRDLFEVLWALGLLGLVAAFAVLALRRMPGGPAGVTLRYALPLGLAALLVSEPVRSMFSTGEAGIVPTLLALLAVVHGARPAWRDLSPVVPTAGLLVGLAAAFQPVLLLFAGLLWLLGRRREAVTGAATFLLASLVAWAAMPAASADYWLGHFAGVGLGGAPDEVGNQSLHGLLLRLGLSGPLEIVLFLLLAAAVVVLGLRRAVRYAQDGQLLLAAALVGCVVVAVSPVAWQHQQLWILLALVGRIGRRKGDRLVWPVLVVMVLGLSSEALVPKIAWLAPLGENAPLLVALAAALALPFVTRTSPAWDNPEPSGPFSRPHLMLELLLIRVGYFAYSWVRSLAPDSREIAEGHGQQILDLEQALHLDWELWINEVVARTAWLESSMNFYYGAFHFLVPVSVLAWLYLRRPPTYRWARNALCYATLLGLVGFLLYPLAPPRLMPDHNYVDTINGPQDFDDPSFGVLTGVSNQYAAMPSLHVGWSLWAGIVLVRASPWLWARLLGWMYPLLTTVVVMGTANHYLLDAAGGAVVVVAGFVLAGLWRRCGPGRSAAEPGADADIGAPPDPEVADRASSGGGRDAALDGESDGPLDGREPLTAGSARPVAPRQREAGERATVPARRTGGSGVAGADRDQDGDGAEPVLN
ncbi:phosphatase PAP2 family protein [Streptomyces sp. P38-E01]|uniref:Phosphatase PAP2 family protein n=1 Tax=Streptomyces tardus TaxID=2780544 RepID=A0A949JNA5_9ACTN|nr:bifunctional glycosyltransferase 87/phosphatase PAP2 family protein [Streptomyces tardus]MBU7599304.1 phosphatase PAP2 family protein [Streptomyces tardus]